MVVVFKKRANTNWKIVFSIFNIDNMNILRIYIPSYAVFIKFDKPRTIRQIYFWNKHRLTSCYKRNMKAFKFWVKYYVLKSPVYYYWSSMDCDLCSSAGYNKADNIYDYLEEEKAFWENVEGRSDMTIIREEEYLENCDIEIESRDYIMEAFENGNGRSVIL